ncbi:MAG: hypothetical protein ACK4N5_13425, partial [Myxococcales bacterium]
EAKPHSFTAVAEPDKVRLGEKFRYVIEVRHDPAERYELPRELSVGEAFNLVEVDATRETKDGVAVTRFVLTAALFELGEKRLPDLTLNVTSKAGAFGLSVPGPVVTGLGALDEQAQLQDIAPPVDVTIPDYRLLYVVAGTILLTLLVLWLVGRLRNRRKVEKVLPPPPPVPAHVRALEALAALQREDPGGREKEMYFRISEILRDYLGERFGFNALDLTTAELLAALRTRPTPGLDYTKFEAFCQEADLVKFARFEASPGMVKAALDASMAFVQGTIPMEPPPARAQGGKA